MCEPTSRVRMRAGGMRGGGALHERLWAQLDVLQELWLPPRLQIVVAAGADGPDSQPSVGVVGGARLDLPIAARAAQRRERHLEVDLGMRD